jgi:hypothetical protein
VPWAGYKFTKHKFTADILLGAKMTV